jgi:hypothetical protein
MSPSPRNLAESVGAGTNVLLLVADPTADGPCVELLTTSPGHGERVVDVALDRTLDDRLRVWTDRAGDAFPSRFAFLTAGDSRRSGTAEETLDSGRWIDPVVVSNPYDLALALGGTLVEFENDGPAAVCFHSVTALLERTSTEATAQFLATLTRRLRTTGSVSHAHFHMDPEAHDDATVERLRLLFDAVVEHRSGEWTVTVQDVDEERPGDARGEAPETFAATDVRFDAVELPRSLDRVMELLSSSRRRAVLYYHLDPETRERAPDDPVSLDRLVDYLAEREFGADPADDDRTSLHTSLVHAHLPKLDDAGIVDYDPEARTVRYHDNPVLWACVEQAAALEVNVE